MVVRSHSQERGCFLTESDTIHGTKALLARLRWSDRCRMESGWAETAKAMPIGGEWGRKLGPLQAGMRK